MSNQHGSGGLVLSLGRKIVFFCVLYCFSLLTIHSVLSLEEGKPEQVLDASGQHQLTKNADKSSHSLPDTSPKKLQDKLDQEYRIHGRPYEGNLWELSDFAPAWMKEYFEWHKQERFRLLSSTEPDVWTKTPLLVMQCLKEEDSKCGGTADRTKPFLFLLREAYMTKRLMFIHWTLPAHLEEFLVPPMGGMNWRAPKPLQDMLVQRKTKGFKIFKGEILKSSRYKTTPIIQTRLQSVDGFRELYDDDLVLGEASFEDVFHDAWRILFTPSVPVQQILESEFRRMGLISGKYSAAHLRALYGRVEKRTEEQVWALTSNAVNCASMLYPGTPILMASDLSRCTEVAVEYGKQKAAKVVAREQISLPLHLDKADGMENRKPSEFYDTFVDLYLMGMARCVTYNRGGFGQWASLLSHNSSCHHNQKTSIKGVGAPCNWTEGNGNSVVGANQESPIPLFVEPMSSDP
ncbi:unnamed protein product [Cylindrotheca closterium]|uniref:Uncharacterized protein n=1 Tax=Cylindrotheca closterium TaxID=2856 RepID=A0AAD2G179_9STRA|nr:unnamed protein product [Cylindrotheca closterium]